MLFMLYNIIFKQENHCLYISLTYYFTKFTEINGKTLAPSFFLPASRGRERVGGARGKGGDTGRRERGWGPAQGGRERGGSRGSEGERPRGAIAVSRGGGC